MVLRGVIENTFGGALCVRGFARIGDLSKISYSKDYQRDVDIKRTEKILEFLKEGTYRFFPELIFSLQFENAEAMPAIYAGQKIELSSNIKFDLYKKDFADYVSSDKFDSPLLRRVSLEFTNETEKYLSRIDGNHRLSAVDELISQDLFKPEQFNYLVPFCIILQLKSEEADKFENAYFHLINSKAKPLTTNENLKSILNSPYYSASEIEQILGKTGEYAKDLVARLNGDEFDGLDNIIGREIHSFCFSCIKLFQIENVDVAKIKYAIKAVDILYLENPEFKASNCNGLLLAFVYYWVTNRKQYDYFIKWVKNNKIAKTSEIKVKSIINIFDKIAEQQIKIFVAMPFFSKDIVASYNDIYKTVINEIKEKYPIDIELYEIMTNEGATLNIVQDIMNKIKGCTIFIADITDNNPNVTYEMGWARALEKPTIILREKDAPEPSSDYKMDYYETYNKAAHLSLKEAINKHLIAVLSKEFGFVIQQ